MAFLINKDGKRVKVDVETSWFSHSCALFADGAILKEVYILNLYQGTIATGTKEIELIKQVVFRGKKPTEEQIMYHMQRNGLSRYDIATIERGYMPDWDDD